MLVARNIFVDMPRNDVPVPPLNQGHVFCAGFRSIVRFCGGIRGLFRSILIILFLSLVAACSPSSPINAKALQNPVPPTEKSVAAGKKMYDKYCADCHGVTGNGVSEKARKLAEAGEAKRSDRSEE